MSIKSHKRVKKYDGKDSDSHTRQQSLSNLIVHKFIIYLKNTIMS